MMRKDVLVVRMPDRQNHPERAKWHIVNPDDGVSMCDIVHTRSPQEAHAREVAQIESSDLDLVPRERVCRWCLHWYHRGGRPTPELAQQIDAEERRRTDRGDHRSADRAP